MNHETRAALLRINRIFYDEYASSFGGTRALPWPAWRQLLEPLRDGEHDRPLRILDVGCGNGRFGSLAAETLPYAFEYEGWDQSQGLLDQAQERLEGRRLGDLPDDQLAGLTLKAVDLNHWMEDEPQPASAGGYDVIGMFGVLHHMPGRQFRADLLQRLGTLLAPGGKLWVSWWMLHRTDRFQKKTVSWDRAPVELDLDDVEPGDHLLSWHRDGFGIRYLHFPTEDELVELDSLEGLEALAPLESDGPTGRENLYLRWTRASIPPA